MKYAYLISLKDNLESICIAHLSANLLCMEKVKLAQY